LLRYSENNWKANRGFRICKYNLNISEIDGSRTSLEQQAKTEKTSLVAFLDREQKKTLINVCRRLKQNESAFYQNSNLHVTLFGFGPIEKEDREVIRKSVRQFVNKCRVKKLQIKFDSIRPGTMYLEGKTLNPLDKVSNGTVIASGLSIHNKDFVSYSNKLGLFLLKDKKIKSLLGAHFRRKFPSVWCTLGHYKRKKNFKIKSDLEQIFSQYSDLTDNELFNFSISEISLVVSNYKNLRYPKLIQQFSL
jgi:hypothetical protein